MTTDSRHDIENIVGQFQSIIERDGGSLVIRDDAGPDELVVDFFSKEGDCRDCVITPEMLHDFLVEALEAHSIVGMRVDVRPAVSPA